MSTKKYSKHKKVVRFFGYVLLFLFLISMLLSTSVVQTRLAKMLTNNLKKTYSSDIVIKHVDLSFLGSIQLKGVEIRDHHKDTLIFVKKVRTSLLNAKKILNNDINLGSVSLDGVHFYLKTYTNEKEDNLTTFVESFSKKPKDSVSPMFLLKTSSVYLNDLAFKISNENKKNPNQFSIDKCGGSLSDFSIAGPDVSAKIRGLYFVDNRGIEITNLTTDFSFTKTQMLFQKTVLETRSSKVAAEIVFDYKREDLAYFNDKVMINAKFINSSLSLADLNKLYDEIEGDDILRFSGNILGTLNHFDAQKIVLISDKGMGIKADMRFVNAVDTDKGFVFDGDLKDIRTNYQQLIKIVPRIVGEKLPSELDRLGDFVLKGKTLVTSKTIDVDVAVASEIGIAKTDLKLTNVAVIDKANYLGEIELIDFNLGTFLNTPLLGKITLGGNVDGSGFRMDDINSGIVALIKKFDFHGYTYNNLNINGLFQNRLFNGNLMVDDTHLKMRFKGLADFSASINKFDFTTTIAHADLVQTNLFTRDSVSTVKGVVSVDVQGNTFDDMIGAATFTDVVYANQKQPYTFKKFRITSAMKEAVKTITINEGVDSKDIARGSLRGAFKFDQLALIAENALGSMYANYKPYKVAIDQSIAFDLEIYNQIVAVFFPEIFIAKNTRIKGSIKAKNEALKLTFSSPKVIAYDNVIDSVSLRMDTKNTLYNTHLTASKITTKYYDVAKFNLLNVTKNDTLFFKSEFKGAVGNKETFNMDFFYTVDKNKKSVLGIQKSTFDFEKNIWRINPADNNENKVVFDFAKEEFEFSPFHLQSNEQEIAFKGVVRDSTYKDLKIGFTKVKLSSFLPPIDSLSLNGKLNGNLNFIQKEGLYSPEGDLSISNFKINSFEQGDLDLKVK
ncbi:MAG: translocation/assembly module TamB, partial [Polaribacter sp.]|nr:translocation/assembly module TamB [Polaribacter sp.]